MRALDVAPAPARPAGSRRSAFLWWLIWILWIPFIVPNILQFLASHPGPVRLVLTVAAAGIFFALYLTVNWRSACAMAAPTPPSDVPTGAALWAPIVVMLAIAVTLILTVGVEWGTLFIYASTCAAGRLPWRQAAYVIAGIVVFTVFGITRHGALVDAISPIAFIVVPGAVVAAAVRSLAVNQELRASREELARVAAVSEERLRIARDLHDLLGHNLSLIALKSELAGRLVQSAPERAAREIADVESVARTALHEVREAVAGYRRPSLAGELAGAREILAAAGITCRQEGAVAPLALPAVHDAALAWAVREGVTNVIRHSHARACTIALREQAREVCLAISDDGRGPSSGSLADARLTDATDATDATTGNGLRGLAERIEALGGHVEAAPGPDGGFRLSVRLPLDRGDQTLEASSPAPSAGLPATASLPAIERSPDGLAAAEG